MGSSHRSNPARTRAWGRAGVFVLALVVLCATGLAGVSTAGEVIEGTGSISGTVTSVETHAPVPAEVRVTDLAGEWTATVAADGTYTVDGLPPGDYFVEFVPLVDGYLAQWYGGAVDMWESTPVSVTADAVVTGVDAALVRRGTISGIVTAADTGAPLAGVVVHLSNGGSSPVATVTDADGAFAATVRPGPYTVHANQGAPGEIKVHSLDVSWTYGGVSTPVIVGSGRHVNVGIVLPVGPRASISGTVRDSVTGEPIEGVAVSADASVIGGFSTVTDHLGRYSIGLLTTESYVVDVDGTDVGYGSTSIDLDPLGTNEARTGVDVELDELTVTYTARYSGQRCRAIENFAAGMGLTPAEMIRLGVNGFRGIAEAHPGTSYAELSGTVPSVVPPVTPDCEFEVTWPASQAAAIESAATWWGGSVDQLHDGGGWVVVVLIYRALVGLD